MSKVRKKSANTTVVRQLRGNLFFIINLSQFYTESFPTGHSASFSDILPFFLLAVRVISSSCSCFCEVVLGSDTWQNVQRILFYFVYLDSVLAYW